MQEKKIKVVKSPEVSHISMLREGACSLKRVACAEGSCPEQALMLEIAPAGWGETLKVDMGEDSDEIFENTPWEEVLKEPVSTSFGFLGKTYLATVKLERAGVARVELRNTFTENVKTGLGVVRKPFAEYMVCLDGTDAERASSMEKTVLGVGGKPCIGLVIGGTPMYIGNRAFGDFRKLSPVPKGRKEVATELYDSMYDALANCDEKWVDVVAYRADTANPIAFRITDRDGHEEALRDIKCQLIDGHISVVNIKPKACVETVYAIVPVDGDM